MVYNSILLNIAFLFVILFIIIINNMCCVCCWSNFPVFWVWSSSTALSQLIRLRVVLSTKQAMREIRVFSFFFCFSISILTMFGRSDNFCFIRTGYCSKLLLIFVAASEPFLHIIICPQLVIEPCDPPTKTIYVVNKWTHFAFTLFLFVLPFCFFCFVCDIKQCEDIENRFGEKKWQRYSHKLFSLSYFVFIADAE